MSESERKEIAAEVSDTARWGPVARAEAKLHSLRSAAELTSVFLQPTLLSRHRIQSGTWHAG